jgi:1-acyl-sn-glycerol-3-phosphate acyltransferase
MKNITENLKKPRGILYHPLVGKMFTLNARTGLEILYRIDKAELAKIPDKGPLIVYSNHTGQVEVPIAFTQMYPRPVTGIAKVETWDGWFLRWLFDLWGIIPIRRGEPDMVAMRMALEALKHNYILGIAPEGTRSSSKALMRAHPGIVSIALHSGAALIPLAHWGGEDFLPNLKRFKRTDFHIRVGEPFRLDPGNDRTTKEVRQAMADEMMCRLAALLPERYRGEYTQSEPTTERYLKPI